MSNFRNFYTVRDLKDERICGPTKAYELIAEGKLKAVKIGRKTLITGDSIRALVDQAA